MTDAPKYYHPEISIAKSQDDLEKCKYVRFQVFIIEQKYPAYIEQNEPIDPIADHYLLTATRTDDPAAERVPVGTVRFHVDDSGAAVLSRLAVLSDARGLSYGRKLVEFIIASAKERQLQTITLKSQYDKRMFYMHLGFSIKSDEIFHPYNVAHCHMIKTLP